MRGVLLLALPCAYRAVFPALAEIREIDGAVRCMTGAALQPKAFNQGALAYTHGPLNRRGVQRARDPLQKENKSFEKAGEAGGISPRPPLFARCRSGRSGCAGRSSS